jgi:hypothetical protein
MTQWAWNDAWILTAISVHKKSGATLAEIIAAADVINHAIPTAGELSRAFSRLVDCGIIHLKNDRYQLARDRQRAVKKSLAGKGGLFSNVDKCLKWLKSTGLEPAQSKTITVSDTEVRAAYESYCASLKKRYRPKVRTVISSPNPHQPALTMVADHDAYIAEAPEDLRPLLVRLRRELARALPDAEEVIAYKMPGFRIGKSIIAGYAAFSKQCGLYLAPADPCRAREETRPRFEKGSKSLSGPGGWAEGG